jgi:hypothetical protein
MVVHAVHCKCALCVRARMPAKPLPPPPRFVRLKATARVVGFVIAVVLGALWLWDIGFFSAGGCPEGTTEYERPGPGPGGAGGSIECI